MTFWELLKRIAKSFKNDPEAKDDPKPVLKKKDITEEVLDIVEDSLDEYVKIQKYTYFSYRKKAKKRNHPLTIMSFDSSFFKGPVKGPFRLLGTIFFLENFSLDKIVERKTKQDVEVYSYDGRHIYFHFGFFDDNRIPIVSDDGSEDLFIEIKEKNVEDIRIFAAFWDTQMDVFDKWLK